MKIQSSLRPWILSGLMLALAPACSSSEESVDDAAAPTPDSAGIGPAKDAATGEDRVAPANSDTPLLDTPTAAEDAGIADTGRADWVGPPGPDARRADSSADVPAGDLGPVSNDASPDQVADGFDPGPVIPIVVNSGPTGSYNLANGTWKVFSFDVETNQVYSVSGLGGGVNGYLGPTASVSPTNFQSKTNADGNLSFVATALQRYFLAVAAQGVGASGSFQIADGGRLLAMGKQAVAMTAPTGDDYTTFHFPISAGHTYNILVEGQGTTSVGLGLSARAERALNRQFSYPLRGLSGPLPINEDIPATSVAESYSGFYYLFIRLSVATNISITITQTS